MSETAKGRIWKWNVLAVNTTRLFLTIWEEKAITMDAFAIMSKQKKRIII